MITRNTMKDVRDELAHRLQHGLFTSVNREASMTAIVGSKTIEVVNASFVADEDALFGKVNWDYVKREEEWYMSLDLSVDAFPGGAPEVWKAIASRTDHAVNSNYGWCIHSVGNGRQFEHVVEELKKNPESRRAVMIYTRPWMWEDYNADGRSDFMCTNAVQYLVRDGAVHAVVQMRSNDALIGFKNDRAWQAKVLKDVADELGLLVGTLHWNAGSLHVYQRDFYLVDHYSRTGEIFVTKQDYRQSHPTSVYLP